MFTDNFTNLLVISGVCKFVFNLPNEIVFGRILPGAALTLAIGVGFYSWLANRLANREQREDVTALPFGISTPVMFVYLFGVIGPIYWVTNDPLTAWQVGLGAGLFGGVVALAGGAIITGMIWGSFTALIIDKELRNAALFLLVAAGLTSIGVLHSQSLHGPELNDITIGYLMMAAFLYIYPKFGPVESLTAGKGKDQ